MDRVKINMIGGGFQHSVSTNDMDPKLIEWVKNGSAPISIHIDNGLHIPTNQNTKNYGWLCESKTIIPHLYDWCVNNIDNLKIKFIKVFTHDVELSKLSDIFQLTQCSAKSYFAHGELYPKSKLVSMIASNKTMCNEHIYRQQMIEKFSGKCDHFGRGYRQIENKEDGLRDYCFSIVMENATYANMFTEKITDCLMTGTIPIYYGISNIGDYFDTNGIIILDDNFKIEELSFELYQSKLEYIKTNYDLAIDLLVAEDYIYKNFISYYENTLQPMANR
jgi:hypothetical protein